MSNQQPPTGVPLRGAVDLSTLGQTPAGASPHSAPPGTIKAVTAESFERDVMELSRTVPVIVDLWATWCQPCKQLSPILERVVAGYDGRLALATIDVDAEPELASAFQVQSIPTVMAVINGQLVPLFQGALPEAQVQQVLDQVVSVAATQGVSGTVAEAGVSAADGADGGEGAPSSGGVQPAELVDPDLDAAADAIEAGDWDAAEAAYRAKLQSDPGNEDATAGLVMVAMQRRIDGVQPEEAFAAADAAPEDVDAQIVAADLAFQNGGATDAFDRLIAAVRATAGDDRETLRTHLIEMFRLLGDSDPRVMQARQNLASALY